MERYARTREGGSSAPWISFGNRHGGRRKWPLFLRGPIPHLCTPNVIQRAHGEGDKPGAHDLPVQVVQLEEAPEVKRISADPMTCAQCRSPSYTPRKRKRRLDTHMWCSEAICEQGNEDTSDSRSTARDMRPARNGDLRDGWRSRRWQHSRSRQRRGGHHGRRPGLRKGGILPPRVAWSRGLRGSEAQSLVSMILQLEDPDHHYMVRPLPTRHNKER